MKQDEISDQVSPISSNRKALITLFDGAKGGVPLKTISFESAGQLARKFRFVQDAPSKDRILLWSRGEAQGGRRRECIRPPYLLVLDVDGSDVTLAECSRRLRDLGVPHAAHETWSHAEEAARSDLLGEPIRHRYRVACAATCESWDDLARATICLEADLRIRAGRESRDQIAFYLPARPEGSDREIEFAAWAGELRWQPCPLAWEMALDGTATARPPTEAEHPPSSDEIRSALEYIPNGDYAQWVRTGQCLHASGLEEDEAFAAWCEWSQRDYADYDLEEQDKKWASFGRRGEGAASLGPRSIFYDAASHGWTQREAVDADPENLFEDLSEPESADPERPASERVPEGLEPSEVLAWLDERYAYVAAGAGVAARLPRPGRPEVSCISRQAFADLHAHPRLPWGTDAKGRTNWIGAGRIWWEETLRRYERMDCYPTGGPACPDDVLNLWTGWGAEPGPSRDAERFLDHVGEVICAGRTDRYEWVLAWMAHMAQRPWERPGTSLVLRSGEGTGKGMFAQGLLALAGAHGFHATQPDHIVGKFNSHLAGKVLVFADEVFWGGRRDQANVLKGLITEDLVVEEKYQGRYRVKNFARLLMASNEEWPIQAGKTARRHTVLDVSEGRRGDQRYFDGLAAWLEGAGPAGLLGALLEVDLGSLPDPKRALMTSALAHQKLLSLDSAEAWLHECLHRGEIGAFQPWEDEPFRVPSIELHRSFLDHCRDSGGRRRAEMAVARVLEATFGAESKQARERGEDGQRLRTTSLPGLARARAAFDECLGQRLNWPADEI